MVNIPRVKNSVYTSEKPVKQTEPDRLQSQSAEAKEEIDEKKSSVAITANAKAMISVQNKIPEELAAIEKDFFKDSKFYSQPVDKKIAILKQLAAMEEKDRSNAQWLYHSSDDTEHIEEILDNPDRFQKLVKYANSIVNNDFYFQNSDKKLKNTIATKIALMRDKKPESWQNLVFSKGYKAIQNGELRLNLIEDIEKDTVVDENYFYNKLERLENFSKYILSKMNVSDEFKTKFLETADIDMSQVKKLFAAVDKMHKKLADGLFDMVLNEKEEMDKNAKTLFIKPCEYLTFFDEILELFETAKKNQETAMKLLQLPDANHKAVIKILNRLDKEKTETGAYRFTTNILDNFIEASKNNKNFSIPALEEIVSKLEEFLKPEYVEKDTDIIRIMIAILNNYCSNNPQKVNLNTFLSYIKKDNIQLCNYLVKEKRPGLLVLEDAGQLLRYSSDIGEESRKFFTSLENAIEFEKLKKEVIKENNFKKISQAKLALNVRVKAPDLYEKLKEKGILKLVAENTIPCEILKHLNKHTDLSTDVYKDAEKVLNNKPVIPEYPEKTNKKTILSKTRTGDVVSIGGKMYINDGKKLNRWNITGEKYLELFSPILRFTAKQARLGDCYFVAVIDNMMSKPEFRIKLYEMFSQEGDDIILHLKGLDTYKYKNKIRFKNGEIEQFPHKRQIQNTKGLQMLEFAYAECALRERTYDIIPHDAPMTVKINRLKAGQEHKVMAELLGLEILSGDDIELNELDDLKGEAVRFNIKKFSQTPEEILRKVGQLTDKEGFISTLSTISDSNTGSGEKLLNKEYEIVSKHAYEIKYYDETDDTICIKNPWNCAAEIKIPVSVLAQYVNTISAGAL